MNRITLDPKDGQEKRVLGASFEVRDAEGDTSPRITGYAAVFNKRSENFGWAEYPFFEVIKPGAFRNVLKDDVRAVIDHVGGLQVLARTKSGTLQLSEDDIGLRFEFDVPDTTAGRDLVTIMKRGDIDQASFAFTVGTDGQQIEEKEENGQNITLRNIETVERLYDVSPVTYPAYPDTLVQARSLESFLKNKKDFALKTRQRARERSLQILKLKHV